MGITRTTTRTFKNGNSQAVRIPKEYALPDGELLIEKIGGAIVIFPKDDPWALFEECLSGFSDDFMIEGRNQPQMRNHPVGGYSRGT
jgi:antitoxin VapB